MGLMAAWAAANRGAAPFVIEKNPARLARSAPFREALGIAGGLPRDLAKNHDHYLHGRPKK